MVVPESGMAKSKRHIHVLRLLRQTTYKLHKDYDYRSSAIYTTM